MTNEPIRVLLVEDEPAHAELVRRAFEARGDRVQLRIAESLSDARACLAPPAVLPHLIISDWRLPDGEGMELLSFGDERLTVPVMIMTSHGNERVAVEALKAGALDYVVKSETTLLDMPHLAERVLREWDVRVERERMQQALRDSEGRFRLLAENATDVISRHDLNGVVLYVSPSCRAVLGYEPADLVGQPSLDLVHPADRATVAAAQPDATDQTRPFMLSFRIRRYDGAYIWFESIGRGIRNATTGELEEIHISSRDITERKRSEEKFYRVFHFSPVAMMIGRLPEMHFMDLNEAFLKMTGFARAEIIGRTPTQLDLWADEDDQARVAALLQADDQLKEIDVKYRTKTGEIGVGLLSFEAIEFGGLPCVLGAYHDITARQRTETALRQYAERLAILHEIDQAILAAKSIEDIADAALSRIHRSVPSWRAEVMLFDFETDTAIVVAAYCNGQKVSTSERQTLAALGSALNLKAGQLYVVDDLTQRAAPAPREQRLVAAGTRSRVDAPLIVLGEQIGVLGLEAVQPNAFRGESLEVVREVADQLAVAIQNARLLEQTQRHAKELEQRVVERTRELAAANERLTELDRLKSKFVSDVSHELRTPIANLKLHVELLEHGRPEKHDHYLTVVKQQARRLGQLVDDILNLSRLEMGKQRVVFGPVDLNFVVEQIVAAHQPRAESSGLALSFMPLADLQPVRGEVNQLAQVVTNLVINALNYTSAGSVQVTMGQSATEACVEIADTGMGIDPDDLPNIFDRFYRGRRSQRSETPGTGLGLAIVKEIIDLHEGRIEVTSQVKQGTTFKVWLPLFSENGAA